MKPRQGETVILPPHGWSMPSLHEVFEHRDLLWYFVMRDIKVRYRQTALGVIWTVLQPLLVLGTMSLVFGRVLGLPSGGTPYPLFCFAGLVLWQFFSVAVAAASTSVTGHAHLIEKVYLPRIIIPIAAVCSGLLSLAISLALLILLMLTYGFAPGPEALLCIPVALLTALFAAIVGSMLAALSVRYRDVNYLIPIALQLWLFASPVIYSSDAVPAQWRPLFVLNPIVGLVEGFRAVLLGNTFDALPAFSVALVIIGVGLPASLMIFQRLERDFADVI